ncbi:MAG: hypothetical protein ACYC7A_09020 [Thermoanaerobaculia bacterium]
MCCSLRFRPILALALCLMATTARAQQYGQWSWWATLGGEARQTTTTIGTARISNLDDQSLRVFTGLSGYVVAPPIAGFDLGLDLQTTRNSGDVEIDQTRTGYNGRLRLLPLSSYPTEVWIGRSQYDFRGVTADDPITLVNRPVASDTWGGRLRLRSGPLGGLLIGADETTNEFEGDSAGNDTASRAFADWSGGRRFKHHARFDYSNWDYGALDYQLEDMTLSLAEWGPLTSAWNWNLSGTMLRRDLQYAGAAAYATDIGQLQNRFVRLGKSGRSLDISQTSGFSSDGSGYGSQSHLVLVRLQQPFGPRFSLTPFAGFGTQLAGDLAVQIPQAGVSASWSGSAGPVAVAANGAVSYLSLTSSDESLTPSSTGLSAGGGFSLTHGDASGLAKLFEISVNNNQFRSSGDVVEGIPGSGDISGTGTEDRVSARMTLSRRWNQFGGSLWGQWESRESSGEAVVNPFSSTVLTGSLQVNGPRFNAQVGWGATTLETALSEKVNYVAGGASYRPWYFLQLEGSYRTDTRALALAPDVDGTRWEGGAAFQLGLLVIRAHMFEATEMVEGAGERTDTGLNVSIDRSFQGWLSIVTAPKRRGVIR